MLPLDLIFFFYLQAQSVVSKLNEEKASIIKQNQKLLGELVCFDISALAQAYLYPFSQKRITTQIWIQTFASGVYIAYVIETHVFKLS